MGRKVYGSLETKRAAGSVMKRFAEWLAEKGHVRSASEAIARSQKASRELPSAERACRILEHWVERPVGGPMIERIEDHFTITRVEASRIWLSPLTEAGKMVGPVPVPRRATELLEVNWDIGGVAERTSRGWRLMEIWKVTP